MKGDVGEALFRFLDRAAGFCLGLVLFFPALIALLNLWPGLPRLAMSSGGLVAIMGYILAHTDSGGQLANGAGLLRGLALLTGAFWLLAPRRVLPGYRPLLIGGSVFLGLSLAAALTSSHPHDAFLGWLDFLSVGIVFLVTSDLVSHRAEGHPLLRWWMPLVALALCTLPVAYLRYLLGFEVVDGRMRGSFFHPNMLTGYLMLFYPLLLARFLEARRFRGILAGLLPLVLVTQALLLAGSRAGLGLLLAVAIATLAFMAPNSLGFAPFLRLLAGMSGLMFSLGCVAVALRGVPWALLLALLAAGLLSWFLSRQFERPREVLSRLLLLVVAVALLHAGIQARAVTHDTIRGKTSAQIAAETALGSSSSLDARVNFWKAAWNIGLAHPWLGVGPEGFHRYHPEHQVELAFFSKFTHCFPLTVLSENGFPAALLMVGLVLAMVRLGWLRWSADNDAEVRTVRLGLLLGAAAFFVASWSDVQWQFPALPLTMAVVLGLGLGAYPAGQPFPEPCREWPENRSQWSIRPGLLVGYSLSVILLVFLMLNATATRGDYWSTFAGVASGAGEREAALDLYRLAIRSDPFQGEHYRKFGLILLAGNTEDPKVREELEWAARRSVELDSHRAVGHDLLGKVAALLHGLEAGRVHFRRALELDPVNYPSFYDSLARSYGPSESALRIYQAALDRFPESEIRRMMSFRATSIRDQLSSICSTLAQFYHPISRVQDADRLYRRALDLKSTNPAALFGLAQLELGRGEHAQALELARRLYGEVPGFEPNLQILAECYQALEQSGEAEKWRPRQEPPRQD